MKSNITFESVNQNKYLYNRKNKSVFFLHPVLLFFLELENNGDDLERIITEVTENLYIKDYGYLTKEEVLYYYNKLLFLKSNNQIDSFSYEESVNLHIKKQNALSFFANSDTIIFEITQRCNLKCVYCAYGSYYKWFDDRCNEDLTFSKAKNLIDFYIKNTDTKYNDSYKKELGISFYGGEPLLNFEIVKQIVEYLKSLKTETIVFKFSMTTNAILIKKYCNFLIENNFNLLISLDGNEENNGYRIFKNNKPAYKKIYTNIIYIKENYPNYFENNVRFNSVLHNKNSLNEVHTFFKNEFNKKASISEVVPDGMRTEKKKDFFEMYKNFENDLKQIEDYTFVDKQQLFTSPDFVDLNDFLTSIAYCHNNYVDLLFNSNKVNGMTATCFSFSLKIFMTVNGKLLPCENVDHKYYLGLVTDDEVKIDFQKIADKYMAYFNKMKKQCFNCYFQTNCHQCLFFIDIDSEKPICSGFIPDHKKFASYLSSRIDMIEEKSDRYLKIMSK